MVHVLSRVIIHVGIVIGAFGGDHVLMALLQIIAARLAEINELVYHTFDKKGHDSFLIAQVSNRFSCGLTCYPHFIVIVHHLCLCHCVIGCI
jgi:hypothetical protein